METLPTTIIMVTLAGILVLLGLLILRGRLFGSARDNDFQEKESFDNEIAQLRKELVASQTTLQLVNEQLDESKNQNVMKQARLTEVEIELSAMKARMEETKKAFDEKEALFKETGNKLKQEFEVLATQIFERQGSKQKESLDRVLNPFKEQIGDFKKKVEEVYISDTKERASLLAEVKNLQMASERINQEAGNLTKALKGDKKLQGNWGELVLERVLEESGLRKDHEYFVQSSYRSDDGDLKRPDVIIRLPDNKDVVVDSKVSLNAYEEALATEADEERDLLLKQYLLNMKSHVKRLSDQDYDRLSDIRSLDFVLLFVPIESAFTLAMQTDHSLFTDAFTKRIVIVSPTTLMMTLRIIRNVWSYEKQSKNTQEIVRKAGALYDKLRLILEDMDALGKQIATANKTYDAAYAKLATGKGNLVRQVEGFQELGAVVKKQIPSQILDQSED